MGLLPVNERSQGQHVAEKMETQKRCECVLLVESGVLFITNVQRYIQRSI